MTARLDAAGRIRERIPEAVVEARDELGTVVLVIDPPRLVEVLTLLRDECGFDMLADLSSVDWRPREPRYDVNYHLYAFEHNDRVRVKVRLPDDDPALPSAVGIWPAADWMEREVWDLMGIRFEGHPGLRRILMPDDWEGHPLRKDYPTGGVPVEYKIEPAYLGAETVTDEARASAGGPPARLVRDRGRLPVWSWTGQPAAGVRVPEESPEAELPRDDETP